MVKTTSRILSRHLKNFKSCDLDIFDILQLDLIHNTLEQISYDFRETIYTPANTLC